MCRHSLVTSVYLCLKDKPYFVLGFNVRLILIRPYILFSCVVKGYRFAMPLSRISLQSPAGSARGQVLLYIVTIKDCHALHFICADFGPCLCVFVVYE